MNANGDTAPRNLGKAFLMARGMVRGARHAARRMARLRRKENKTNAPRQVCAICSQLFDYAIVDKDSKLIAAHCPECKAKLADGYIAGVAIKGFIFFKMSDPILHAEYAGKVIPCSDEQYQQLYERHHHTTKPADTESQERPDTPDHT